MVWSMLAVFACIALGWAALVPRPAQPVRTVDFAPVVAEARARGAVPVVAPSGLPPGWKATSAALDRNGPGSVHIGFVTPSEEYAEVEQSAEALESFTSRVLGSGSSPRETATFDGHTWQMREVRGGDRALVRGDGGASVIVRGSASWSELGQLVDSLG